MKDVDAVLWVQRWMWMVPLWALNHLVMVECQEADEAHLAVRVKP